MNKKKIGIGLGVILVIILLIWQPWKKSDETHRIVEVQKGLFETTVSAMGELKAQQALDINIPEVSFERELRIWELKIMSLVEEGKIVKKGDEVATLEPTEVQEKLTETNDRLSELYTLVEDAKIDSSITLMAARETIQKQRDNLLDAELKVQQSSYESKAVQRQSQIELEKAQRSLSKAKRDLITQTQNHKRKIARHQERVDRFEHRKKLYEQLLGEMSIKSPADGMIIYGYGYDGQKVKVGSYVGRWMPLIATLPDLNTIISEIEVKEIDIAKVAMGQKVKIKIDAFPKKVFSGEIISIANVGQEIPGEFQNGFKVIVKIIDYKDALLPGMTSTNTIVTNSIDNALFVEKAAVLGNDSLRYVIKKDGLSVVRQEVKVGYENEMFYSIEKGLSEGDKVYINYAENAKDKELVRLH
nr:HlyD family efflux transporter periplasmic adaptor subunit [uncultured Carboxylicivirga sp.]